MRPLRWLFGLSAVSRAASGAAVLDDAGFKPQPLPPSQDPWYSAPLNFETKQPGDMLRIRLAPGNLTSVIDGAATAYHILYRTTDSRYRPSWAVTTLLIPSSVHFSPLGKAALLSYQFAYNSANLDSSPSIGLYSILAQENTALGIKSSTSFLSTLLSRGWIINTPDYMGPDAAFGASVQAGHATLDSIRAVINLGRLTGSDEFTTVMWGYSGGSIATGAAAELQTQYAPELDISGTVLGGLVDNISADFENLNKSPIAGTLVAFLLGVTAQYAEAKEYLESRLRPEIKDGFLSVRDISVSDAVKMFAQKDIYSYFKGGVADLQAPVLRKVYNAQAKLGFRGVPNMPMFVYKAIGDQFCPIEQTDVTVERWCSGGAEIIYERKTVGEHVSEIENGKLRALEWISSIFDHSYEQPSSECDVREVMVGVQLQKR
ncbi:hypothetical protein jhhlp_000730 [Lomentospora prolificans]|uniref:Uncharacterized protein n=1 Tax=Lomentospora prolificans TaxID=41688 RepID=A0A2N3NJB3_9PEZI|nr:hypothetical protein jhhlp_000730 [Lomentospora prolificans]